MNRYLLSAASIAVATVIASSASAQIVLVPDVPLVFNVPGASGDTVDTAGNGIVTVDSGVDYTLSGVVSGAGSLSQTGLGNLILTGDNTYTNLGINAGTVTLGSNTAGGIGGIAINNNATLAAGANGLVIANEITTTANGIVDAGAAGNVFTLDGDIIGAGSISQVGEGNLVLNGDNSFTNLGINKGTVTLGSDTAAGAGGITINDNATLAAGADGLVIANNIQTTGNGIVNAGAAGNTFTLDGIIDGAGSISQVGEGNLVLNGDNSFANLGINKGTVTLGSDTAGGAGNIAINNNATLAAGADGLVIFNEIATTGNGLVDAGPAGNTFTLDGNIGGAGSISQVGLGNLQLGGENTFTNLGINAGTVTLSNDNGAGIGGISINNNATLATVGGGVTVANAITTTANGLINAGESFTVFTLNGNIGGAGSISQVGEGNLVLNGNNSYTNLGINKGTVTLGTNTAGGKGGIAINNNATLAAGANNLVIANAIGTTANGIVNAGPAGNTMTLNGNITGAGSISQVGEGNLVLNGNNSYKNLGINKGTVTLGTNTAGGSANIAINNNATLAAGANNLVVANAIQTTANGIVNAGAAGNTFTLSGPITGAGSISQVGAGNLVLNGNNSYKNLGINKGTVTLGTNTAGGSANIAINNNATLAAGVSGLVVANNIQTTGAGTINSGTGTFTLSGVISDVGSITKTGAGKLILTGANTYTGATTVAAGNLAVNGSNKVSVVTVNSGATLSGTGTVGTTNIEKGGILSPGNSIGTLVVNGNLNQAAGSIYAVELGAAPASDRVVAGGSANISAGAIVNVTNTTGSRYVLGSKWTILQTGVARNGVYTLTGDTQVSEFIDVVASYDAKNAYLSVNQTSSFASAADTENQAAAAFGADVPGSPLYSAIAYLPDAASAQYAFDQISGELHASLNSATFEDSRFVREAIYNHTADQFMPGMGMWVAGFGSWGAANSDGNASGYDRSIGGFFLGFDGLKTETASVGVLTGYSTADVSIPELGSSATTDDLYVGLYGSYDIAGFSLTGAITNTWRWVKTHRQIAFEGFSDYARADYSINTFQVFGEAAYQFRFSGIGIEPYANFAYISVSSDSFSEYGGSAALFSDDDGGSDYWATQLGLRASYGLPVWGDTFSLTASAGWRYVFEGDTLSPVTMHFANGPDFTVYGAPIAQNAIATSFDISKKLGDRADASIGYSGQYGDGWHDNGLRASLRLRF